MEIAHDTEPALRLAVDLVNAEDGRHRHAALDSPAELTSFLTGHQVSAVGRVSDADVRAIRRLRDRLRTVFESRAEEDAAAILNDLLTAARARPELTNHDGTDWHLHYSRPDAPLVHRVAADAAGALARVVAQDGLARLRVCEADDCEHVFVDMSRNRSRRYCDPAGCGNRMHVAAYRARRRAGV